MKLTKKELLIIILVIALTVLVLSSFIYSNFFTKSLPGQTLPPIIIYSPKPTQTSNITPPDQNQQVDLGKEKIMQQNYAASRSEFLKEKPWIAKLPLESTFYFISYSPGRDSMLVTIYYFTGVAVSKPQQINEAKQKALSAMTEAGVDVNTQKIIYTETEAQ